VRDHADSMTREERDRFLGNAAADVDRLDRLVGRLLELARAEAPMRRGHVTEVGTAARAVAAPFQATGLPLQLDGLDVPVYAAISSEALHAILENLFENIRQHAGPGAAGTVVWRADPQRRQAAIEVSDTGKGVSAGNAGRIFDRFFTTARDRGGTGLGLAIVRGQLASAGGTICLAGSGPGAVFRIWLPLADAPAAAHGA
jgi:signal transduction histidine kinase